jgi:hypothetical protein
VSVGNYDIFILVTYYYKKSKKSLYLQHGDNKLHFNEMMMMFVLY